jgi:TolA-binding protein
MPQTRSFKEFVKSRIERDSKFRQALFQEAVQALIEGDVDTAKSVLRDYIDSAPRHHRRHPRT